MLGPSRRLYAQRINPILGDPHSWFGIVCDLLVKNDSVLYNCGAFVDDIFGVGCSWTLVYLEQDVFNRLLMMALINMGFIF